MCRTGADTQFKQCLSVIASFARWSGAQIGLNGRCNGGRHKIVSSEERIETRKKFLLDEREFTRVLDEVNPQRRDLPFGEIHGIGDCCPDFFDRMPKISPKEMLRNNCPSPRPLCAGCKN